jgi:hypothetical protein
LPFLTKIYTIIPHIPHIPKKFLSPFSKWKRFTYQSTERVLQPEDKQKISEQAKLIAHERSRWTAMGGTLPFLDFLVAGFFCLLISGSSITTQKAHCCPDGAVEVNGNMFCADAARSTYAESDGSV